MPLFERPFEEDVVDRLARIETHLESINGQRVDQETRLRTLEHRQWLLAGAAAAVGPIISKLGIHLPFFGS